MIAGSESGRLVHFVDDAIHGEVVRRRGVRRAMADRAVESATWAGTLRDLAERRVEVAIHLAGGRVHRGRLTAAASDHLVVTSGETATVLIAMSAVRSLRLRADLPRASAQGDRRPAEARTLPEALEELLAHGADVVVGLQEVADPVRGKAEGLGEDLLTVAAPGGGAVLVPIVAIADVVWGTA